MKLEHIMEASEHTEMDLDHAIEKLAKASGTAKWHSAMGGSNRPSGHDHALMAQVLSVVYGVNSEQIESRMDELGEEYHQAAWHAHADRHEQKDV